MVTSGPSLRHRGWLARVAVLLLMATSLCFVCSSCADVAKGGEEASFEDSGGRTHSSGSDGVYSLTFSQVAAARLFAAAYADECLGGDIEGLSLGAAIPTYHCRSLGLNVAGTVSAERAATDLIPLCRDDRLIAVLGVTKDAQGEYEQWYVLDESYVDLFSAAWSSDSGWCQLSVTDWDGRPGTVSSLGILFSADAMLAYYTDSEGELVAYDGLQKGDLALVEGQVSFSAIGCIADVA